MVDALAERIGGVPQNQLMMQKLMINQALENMGPRNTRMIDQGTFDRTRNRTMNRPQ